MPLRIIKTNPFLSWIYDLYRTLEIIVEYAGYALIILVRSVLMIRFAFEKRREIVKQMYIAGAKSFLVVSIVAFFTGMILCLQTGIELKRFGIHNLIGQLVTITLTREMAPLMTAVVLIASVGSAIAAEISTMKVSEEIDALEMLLISPIRFLVMPRVVALGLMFPIVTVYFTVLGVFGGMLVADSQLAVDRELYMKSVLWGLKIKAMYTGLLKSFLFGVVVAIVSCANGFRAENGVAGVGHATRNSVIASFMMVLIIGYFITAIFYGK